MSEALDKLRAYLTRPNGAFVAFWVYVLAFAVLRLAGSPYIGTDDVQQALAAQSWAWGYEPRNPPLYTWLLMGAYSAFGVTQIAHVFVKYALILATFVFAYLSGRRMFKTPGYAELSALSLMMVHLIGISEHTVFTHTVALGAALFMTWWAVLRVLQERRALDYALLGVACALGTLAKYNFVLILAPILLLGLSRRDTRAAVLDGRMLIAIGIAALMLAPHTLWVHDVRFDFLDRLRKTSGVEAHSNYAANISAGFADLVSTMLVELAPFWIVAAIAFWPQLRAARAQMRPEHRLLWFSMALNLAFVILFIFTQGASELKSRYLAPLILQAPLALFAWLDEHNTTPLRLRWYVVALVATAVLTYAGIFWQSFFYHEHCKRCWREMPIEQLAQQMRAGGFTGGTIIANEWHVGGNLRLQFPDAAILVPGFAETSTPRTGGQCAMAWNTRLDGVEPPEHMVRLAAERIGAAPGGSPVFIRAPLLRSHRRLDGLAYWIVPNADGNCRGLAAPP
jgi:4-amino-4-deoxy-L-arabinose transferase-like glycosyltransferase